MEKADLCKFMSNSVAAAVSGEEAKAVAFWAGLALLRPYFTSSELAGFVCDGIASRLKAGQGPLFVMILKRVGGGVAKKLLTKQPVLRTLPEFAAHIDGMSEGDVGTLLDGRRKRRRLQ
jgi:hypothetical protein